MPTIVKQNNYMSLVSLKTWIFHMRYNLNPKKVVRLYKEDYSKNWDKTYKDDVAALGGRCEQCGCTNSFKNPLNRHHILEKSRHRGPDTRQNLKLLCRKCHKEHHKNG